LTLSEIVMQPHISPHLSTLLATPSEVAEISRALERPIGVTIVPYKPAESSLPPGVRETRPHESPDLILLNDMNAARLIEFHAVNAVSAIVPVIDAAGFQHLLNNANRQRSDLAIATISTTCLSAALPRIIPMVQRFRMLPEAVLSTSDRRLQLLARLFVRGRGLVPHYDLTKPYVLRYFDADVIPDLITHADALVDLGALERTVFETLTVCPACESARLLVRLAARPTKRDRRQTFHCLDCDAEHSASGVASKPIYTYHPCGDTLGYLNDTYRLRVEH
jgi:hypothetical protein